MGRFMPSCRKTRSLHKLCNKRWVSTLLSCNSGITQRKPRLRLQVRQARVMRLRLQVGQARVMRLRLQVRQARLLLRTFRIGSDPTRTRLMRKSIPSCSKTRSVQRLCNRRWVSTLPSFNSGMLLNKPLLRL